MREDSCADSTACSILRADGFEHCIFIGWNNPWPTSAKNTTWVEIFNEDPWQNEESWAYVLQRLEKASDISEFESNTFRINAQITQGHVANLTVTIRRGTE